MREILFKAKRKDWENLPKEEWWGEGAVIPSDDCVYIATSFLRGKEGEPLIVATHEVIPDTLCQYTGLTDKNGQKIWEGDIVTCSKRRRIEGYDMYKVVWRKDFADFGVEPLMYGAQYPIGFVFGGSLYGRDYKVIGNIFDNPELLEVE